MNFGVSTPNLVRHQVWPKKVDGISVFKDFGERNDVYVRGLLTQQTVGKQPQLAVLETDVHKYAHKFLGTSWLILFDQRKNFKSVFWYPLVWY